MTVAQKNQKNQEELIHQEVQTLLDKGDIVEVPPAQADEDFYSTLFLVSKKEGQHRPVVNLRLLNRFVKAELFKIEMNIVRGLLQKGDWMTQLDLKDAFLFTTTTRNISDSDIRTICWWFQSHSSTYIHQCLTSGDRLIEEIVHQMCVIYLDDILIMNQDKELTHQQTWAVMDLLKSLSFLFNYKSVLDPVQEIVFLEFVPNSIAKEVRLPQQKLSQIQHQLLSQNQVSAKALANFIGKLSAAILAIYPAPLHYRSLQQLKHKAFRVSGLDGLMTISPPAQDLEWWIKNLGNWNGRIIQQPQRWK